MYVWEGVLVSGRCHWQHCEWGSVLHGNDGMIHPHSALPRAAVVGGGEGLARTGATDPHSRHRFVPAGVLVTLPVHWF